MRKVEYNEYIHSELWEKRRGKYLLKRPYCEHCYGEHRLCVHHRTYKRLGSEEDRDLMTLCEPHHYSLHSKTFLLRSIKGFVRMFGIPAGTELTEAMTIAERVYRELLPPTILYGYFKEVISLSAGCQGFHHVIGNMDRARALVEMLIPMGEFIYPDAEFLACCYNIPKHFNPNHFNLETAKNLWKRP